MNSYERVVAALEPSDPGPRTGLSHSGRSHQKIGRRQLMNSGRPTPKHARMPIWQLPDSLTLTASSPNTRSSVCDAWGQKLIFSEEDAAHPDYSQCVIQEIEDYDKIKKVDYRTSKRMMMHIDVCKRLVKELKGEKPIVAFVFGPLGTLSMLRNQEDMYLDLYDDPDAVKRAAREINETLKE